MSIENLLQRIERLTSQKKAIDKELARIVAATNGTASRKARVKKSGVSGAGRKRMAEAKRKLWARAKKLGLKSLADLKKHDEAAK